MIVSRYVRMTSGDVVEVGDFRDDTAPSVDMRPTIVLMSVREQNALKLLVRINLLDGRSAARNQMLTQRDLRRGRTSYQTIRIAYRQAILELLSFTGHEFDRWGYKVFIFKPPSTDFTPSP